MFVDTTLSGALKGKSQATAAAKFDFLIEFFSKFSFEV